MSMQYVIARQCIGSDDTHLAYLMEEDSHDGKGVTKVFNSQKKAKKWLHNNIPTEDQEETMIIPLSEVPEWDGEKL